MSRTTAGIMRISQELDKISGLDGIVADKIEKLEKQVKIMVNDILENHSEASIFNYYGSAKKSYNKLEKIVGKRYKTLELLKNDIEIITGKNVNAIIESESERPDGTDFMIDIEFEEFNIYTIFYLLDNNNRYYITEV